MGGAILRRDSKRRDSRRAILFRDAGTADAGTMALALMLRRYHWLC